MATDFSTQYIRKSEKRIKYTSLYFRMKYWKYIYKVRFFLRNLMKNRFYPNSVDCALTDNLEKSAVHFQKHGWAYIENILSKEFHQELIKNWPCRIWFNPPNNIVKSYDSGFGWSYGNPPILNTDIYNQHKTIKKFFNLLHSKEFENRITKFVGRNKDFICYSYTVNSTYVGSEVMPHKDSIKDDPKAKNGFLNIVFFINGTGGKNSGNLSLSLDNELKDLIVEPENLKNACLIYDSLADFYHGFSPVAKGKFRWAINSQFCERGYVEQ